MLELKATASLRPLDEAQLLTYLKVTGLKLGLLVNFGSNELEIKRIPNFVPDRTVHPPLPDTDNIPEQWLHPALTGELRFILYEVHNELGPGLMHMHYRRAAQIELRWRDIPYQVKKEITIHFRGQPVETREVRLIIVDNKIVLAPIAVREITPRLRGRFRQYLKLLDLEIGLIANFHAPGLEIETVRL